jgi:hypothetical protein
MVRRPTNKLRNEEWPTPESPAKCETKEIDNIPAEMPKVLIGRAYVPILHIPRVEQMFAQPLPVHPEPAIIPPC